ncbi:MAG TPA: protein kinase [Candidatus Saccharimonadia bacterium]|nr:protein kinase [Candidatus Saccharimonadia bacterium]
MTSSETQIPGYELLRELGQGGMATVWLAIQRSLDRKVAIKVMKRNIDDLEKFERRFLVEGRTMAKLPHRNIVAVYDIVKGDEVTYIAMEFLDGGTLSEKMKEGLSLGDAIAVVVQIAHALQFAHEHGVVHRDLKPANIMFRDNATPVLTDFGIAKHQDQGSTRLTQTGMLVGTPTYMSPEQINALDVDGRSDLYALGILFYELLTGAPPFQADTPIAVLMSHLTQPPPPLPAQFADFQPVVDRMLAKNRDERYPDLREFTRELKSAVVNNQNLFATLQADPSQSSSEQLRALGFSVSGSQTANLTGPVSGQVRLPPSYKGGPRTPTPTGGARFPPVEDAATYYQGPPAKKPWALIGGAIAGVIAIAVAAVVFWPKPEAVDVDPAVKGLVDAQLNDVDKLVASGDLAGARSALLNVIVAAPNYSRTKKTLADISAKYRASAEAALGQGEFLKVEEALANVESLTPDDPALAKLKERLNAAQQASKNRKQIDELIARADEAARAGRLTGPNSAYAALGRARQLAPEDAAIRKRYDELVARALQPAQAAIASRDVAGARTTLDALQADLANEPAFKKLRADLDSATDAVAKKVRLDAVLGRFDQQLAAGQLLEPAQNNARESLGSAQMIDAASPDVARRRTELANALAARAQQSLDAGRAEEALNLASSALSVQPDLARADTLKRNAEGKLGAARAQLIAALAQAKTAMAEQRFVAPDKPNAREAIEAALKLDPQNAEAQQLLAELPKRIAETVEARIAAGELDSAQKLVADARKLYAADAQLGGLATQITQRLAGEQAKAARIARLESVAQLIAARPLKDTNVASAAKEISALLAANPADVDAVTLRKRLVDALSESLVAAQTLAEADAVNAAYKQAQTLIAADPGAQQFVSNLTTTRARLVGEEQQRLEALKGELVLNAYPWATVERVENRESKQAIALPADATTPLRISVPEGVYTVTFKHPDARRSVVEVARVEAKKSSTKAASFAASVTSDRYLRSAGY